jgi:hypothetical protein
MKAGRSGGRDHVRCDSCRVVVGRSWLEPTAGRGLLPQACELQQVVRGNKGILAGAAQLGLLAGTDPR